MRALAIVAPVLAFAGCGDDAGGPPAAAPDAAPIACAAAFSGNFEETSSGSADCATLELGKGAQLGHQLIVFAIPVRAFDSLLEMSFDLGTAPAPGLYTSETVGPWSAVAFHMLGDGFCAYKAGTDSSPQGTFTLVVDSFDLPVGATHGTLSLVQPVLALTNSMCGAIATERVDVHF